MSQYKELADRLDRSTRHDAYMHAVIAKAIAILRSLDAQPVAEVMVMGSYRGKPILGCVLHSDSAKVGDKLYAAPVAAQPSELDELRKQKDGAYFERNQVVAALAKCFPSGVAKTAIEGWSEDWHGCVYIDLPTGQVSWHFHDSQAYLFKDLPPYAGKWDGHDTPEKYRRVNALAAQPSFAKGSWQHAVDDQLVGFGRTSQEFGSPHEAVRWLIEQEVQAAQPTEQKKCNLISDEDSCQATEIIRCLTCHRHVSGPCNTPAQPQQAKPEPLSDAEFAINMLEMMFTAYENGTPCYEDPEDEVGFMGYAFRLADDDFKNIGDFLNRVRPVQSCIKEQG